MKRSLGYQQTTNDLVFICSSFVREAPLMEFKEFKNNSKTPSLPPPRAVRPWDTIPLCPMNMRYCLRWSYCCFVSIAVCKSYLWCFPVVRLRLPESSGVAPVAGVALCSWPDFRSRTRPEPTVNVGRN